MRPTRLLPGLFVSLSLMSCLTAERSLLDTTTIEGLTLFHLVDLQATPLLPVSGVSLWLRAQDARIQDSQTVWADRSGLSCKSLYLI